jgi:hypothetical protein
MTTFRLSAPPVTTHAVTTPSNGTLVMSRVVQKKKGIHPEPNLSTKEKFNSIQNMRDNIEGVHRDLIKEQKKKVDELKQALRDERRVLKELIAPTDTEPHPQPATHIKSTKKKPASSPKKTMFVSSSTCAIL